MAARRRGLSAAHVGELAGELRTIARGMRVREVQPLPPRDALLILAPASGEGHVRRLRLSADPRAARLHLQIGRVRRHAGPPGPFYRRVEERLAGLVLTALEALGGDRVARLDFAEEESGDVRAALVLELFGRHANQVLLDGRGHIEAVLVEPAAESAAAERLAERAPYAPPAGQPPIAAGAAGPPLDEALPAAPEPPNELARLAPLSWRVEASLGVEAEEHHEEQEKKDLRRRLDRARKSTRHHIAGLEEKRRGAADAERVRMDGELLTAHFGRLKRGMKEVELEDFHDPDGGSRTIALDPRLSPKKNAERLFARYKKLKRSAERVPEELALATARLEQLEALGARLAAGDEAVPDLEREAIEAGLLRPRQGPPERRKVEPRRPYHRFRSQRGLEIRVGRSARDNDELTFRHARGNDLWLHTADVPGSHVVLKVGGGRPPDPEDVLDAAHLAVHFSPLAGARRADVHVAHQKEVRKPKRAPAGLVTLSGGKIRVIRMDAERLARLLDTRRGPAGESGGAP